MKKFLVLLTLTLLSQKTVSSIIPELQIPSDFNKDRFEVYYNDISINSGNHSCGYISFKNFYPPEYILKKIKNPPFDTWFCLHSVDIIHNGYGPGKILTEKIYFDKKNKVMEKEKI